MNAPVGLVGTSPPDVLETSRVPLIGFSVRQAGTPGWIRAVAIMLAAVMVVAGAVDVWALRSRERAATALSQTSEPALAHAANLYRAMSDADATAARAFVTGGIEPQSERDRYLQDMRTASAEAAALAAESSHDRAIAADIATIDDQLQAYAGLVETARTYNRDGFPVGDAYLRNASGDLRATILPAVLAIYRTEADRVATAYHGGTSPVPLRAVLIAAAVFLLLAVAAQFWLALRTRRVFNAGLAAATVVAICLTALCAAMLVRSEHALTSARRNGSDALTVLSSARILAMRMRTDEMLELAGRGTDRADYRADFNVAAEHLRAVTDLSGFPGSLSGGLAAYLLAHGSVNNLEDHYRLSDAITVATTTSRPAPGLAVSESTAFDRFIANLDDQVAVSHQRFATRVRSAGTGFAAAYTLVVIAVVAIGALIAAGAHVRLREYQ
jgi:hypothetical protein